MRQKMQKINVRQQSNVYFRSPSVHKGLRIFTVRALVKLASDIIKGKENLKIAWLVLLHLKLFFYLQRRFFFDWGSTSFSLT